jgi:bifunctional non-homologous end joining protein LigD
MAPEHSHLDLCLASVHRTPFDAEGWLFELKADGFRALARHVAGNADVISRRGRSLADRFPEIVEALALLPELVLDAELVVPDERGHPSFDRVRNRALRRNSRQIQAARAEHAACLCVFDVL